MTNTPHFTTGFVYPEPRPTKELEAVPLTDKAAIVRLELELHNESQLSRRAAIIQLHLNSIKDRLSHSVAYEQRGSAYDLEAVARQVHPKRRRRR